MESSQSNPSVAPPPGVPSNEDNGPLACLHCGATKYGRNLVVTLDGTSNQLGQYNTNAIELHYLIIKDKKQLTYYSSGIGTYARPSFASFTYWKKVLDSSIDVAIAWNFEKLILGAYRWLSDNYEPGDKIFLFGFSRGAYQVRALAGMIQEVGLIPRGNEAQIPFAYEKYANLKGRRSGLKSGINMAERFKRTFSQEEVAVHFLGAWDTVSSIGIARTNSLPGTEGLKHVCYVRHALALDERRVKFLPEYVCGGDTDVTDTQREHGPHIKEVWFSGCHSDIGGGSKENAELNNAAVPVLWMGREAKAAGLRLHPSKVIWNREEFRRSKPTESLTWAWRLAEIIPFKRLSYKDREHETRWPHLCKGRTIKKGQKIHASVIFIDNYSPQATLPGGLRIKCWDELLERGKNDSSTWAKGLEDLLEIDPFDFSDTEAVVKQLYKDIGDSASHSRLAFIASTRDGAAAIAQVGPKLTLLREMLGSGDTKIADSGRAILAGLTIHGITGSCQLLVQTLASESSDVRISGAKVLLEIGGHVSVLRQCADAGAGMRLVEMINANGESDEGQTAKATLRWFNAERRKCGIPIPAQEDLWPPWDVNNRDMRLDAEAEEARLSQGPVS